MTRALFQFRERRSFFFGWVRGELCERRVDGRELELNDDDKKKGAAGEGEQKFHFLVPNNIVAATGVSEAG